VTRVDVAWIGDGDIVGPIGVAKTLALTWIVGSSDDVVVGAIRGRSST